MLPAMPMASSRHPSTLLAHEIHVRAMRSLMPGANENDFFERAEMPDTNTLQSAIANVTPAASLAAQHRRMAEPRSGTKANG